MKIKIFDAVVWKTGHSQVVTIPNFLMEKMNLKNGDRLEVRILKLEE